MKPVAMFVLGAFMAAALVYFVVNRGSEPAAAPVQTAAQQPVVAQPADPQPEPSSTTEAKPEAAAAAASAAAEQARETVSRIRKPSPLPRSSGQRNTTPAQPQQQSAPAQQLPAQTAQNLPPAPVAPAPPAPPVEQPRQMQVEQPKPEPRQPKTVTIPSGTLLTVRLDEALGTDKNQAGDSFRATLDQPLVIDGFVIAERGARVEGRLSEMDAGGRVSGLARMSLELVRLSTSDGQHVRLQTESFAKQAERTRSKDAAKIGAAAGIGAAIGAIAGGGKGAAIGAAAGGAAGTGGVMATRGEAARLPAETRLSFRLNQPITVTEKL